MFGFLAAWFLVLVLMIWGLIDVVKVPDDSFFRAGSKVLWVLLIAFLNILGVILYVAIGRPKGGAKAMPSVRPVSYAGARAIDFRGVRYALGRTDSAYAIWDSAAGGAQIRTYPLTEQGWSQAWKEYYEELEGAPPPQR
jgi:hypothetical protein